MYTVIRFRGDPAKFDEMGALVNQLRPGSYQGPDRRPTRFSLSLSNETNWLAHCAELITSIRQLSTAIVAAQAAGFSTSLDIAVWPEEYKGRWLTELAFSLDLIKLLAEQRIEFFVTLYGFGESETTPEQKTGG